MQETNVHQCCGSGFPLWETSWIRIQVAKIAGNFSKKWRKREIKSCEKSLKQKKSNFSMWNTVYRYLKNSCKPIFYSLDPDPHWRWSGSRIRIRITTYRLRIRNTDAHAQYSFTSQAISVSASLLVKQRKLLKNILVMHGSLDILLDVIELTSGKKITFHNLFMRIQTGVKSAVYWLVFLLPVGLYIWSIFLAAPWSVPQSKYLLSN